MFGKKYTPTIHRDDRGEFCELFSSSNDSFFGGAIRQVSLSTNERNVFRGMHFQYDQPMKKGMRVVHGAVDLIEMDMRPLSPTFGKFAVKYAQEGPSIYYAPAWVARGFFTYDLDTVIEYFHDACFNPAGSVTISYTELTGYDVNRATMSPKDRYHGMLLSEWKEKAIRENIFVDSQND
jgi:dTDP-4-dehydrorhamnose 3,5-epimerase